MSAEPESESTEESPANVSLQDVVEEMQALREEVDYLRDELEAERKARKELEDELEAERDAREELEIAVNVRHEKKLEYLGKITVGDENIDTVDEQDKWISQNNLVDTTRETESDVGRLEDRVQDEQKARASNQKTALKRITQLEEEVGVEPEDAFAVDATGEDMPQLRRLLVHGPSAVTDRVYPVHHRAKAILEHAGDWGTTTSDKFGERVVLNAVEVRTHLDAWDDDTRIKSKHVRRAFEKIVDLGDDLPKEPKMGKNQDGEWRLKIWNVTEDE